MGNLANIPDPKGRLDVLLFRLAEQGVRFVERRFGLQVWDGAEGLGGVVEDKIRELKVPDKPITGEPGAVAAVTPRSLAEQVGFIKRRRARKAVK